jgi:Family of unknown function (DUF6515)
MKTPRIFPAWLLASLVGVGGIGTASLHAERHVDIGLSVGVPLPHGYLDVVVGHEHYYSYRGTFYRRGPRGFVVVRAPRGAMLRELPPHCARIYVGRVVYYRFGDVYYQAVPQGYVVVDAPAAVRVPPPPPAPDYQAVWVGNTEYLFKDGQFFLKTPDGLVWTQAPLGAVTKTLPADATSIWYEDNEYFECGDVYFRKSPEGYRVVAAPWKK